MKPYIKQITLSLLMLLIMPRPVVANIHLDFSDKQFKLYMAKDCPTAYVDEHQKEICISRINRATIINVQLSSLSKDLPIYKDQIRSLAEKLSISKDIKETADITAALQALSAYIEARKLQIHTRIESNKESEKREKRETEQIYREKAIVTNSW